VWKGSPLDTLRGSGLTLHARHAFTMGLGARVCVPLEAPLRFVESVPSPGSGFDSPSSSLRCAVVCV